MGPNMPSVSASVFCEPPSTTTTTCSDAIRDSLAATKSAYVDRGLQSAVKRTQMSKIEYEVAPPDHHNNVIDTLKAKYTVLAAAATGNNGTAAVQHNGTPARNNMGNGLGTGGGASASNTANGVGSQLPTPKRCLFQRNLVQIGWKQPSGRHWSTGSGMSNVGNTCYLNSTLQALFHVPSFANFLYADDEHRKRCEETNSQTECIICSMARTLNDTQTQGQCVKPYRVYSKLRQICRHLVQGHQEDAHEFLRYLVEAMEKAYLLRFKNSKEFDQYTKETTPMNQILGGYLKSSVRCLDCGHVSVTFQHFQDLLLDIRKSSSIDEALDTHFARERLEDMGYKCEACKKKVSATKQFSLERAPIALCIQLKRFSMMGGKMNKHVSFSPRLNLSKYSARRAQTGDNADPQMIYRLVSMVTHLGSSQHCGHYTAVGLTSAGAYYTFDDSSVRPIAQQNVLQTNAYIMFYELEDPAAIRNAEPPPPASYQQTMAHSSPATPTAPTTPGDSKKSFIGPVMPVAEAKTNGTAATPTAASNGQSGVPKPISKLVLNISSSNTTNKTWTGSKLVPTVVRNNAAANGHAPQTTTTANGHHLNGHNNGAFTADGPKKLLKPSIASAPANTATPSSATSLQSRITSKLPSMPNLDLTTEAESPPTTSTTTPSIKPIQTTSTTTTASSIAFTAPPVIHHANGHAHKASNGAATPPSSPDVAAAPKPLPPSAFSTTTTTAKTNGHQPRVTNGFTTSSATVGRSLVPYDDDSSDATGQSEDDSADKTPPTIKTKAGVFQVTTVSIGPNNASAVQPLTTSSNGGDKTNANNAFKKRPASADGTEAGLNGGASVASKLMKMSHRGYGVEVSTWGGQASNMDQELKEDRLAEQRRRQEIDVDAEMDAGRQKKVKAAQPMAGPSNPGYNVFQGTQNNINVGHHRWSSNFHNRKQKPNAHGFGHQRHKHHQQQQFKNRHSSQHHHHNNQNHNGGRPRPTQPPRD